MTLEIGTKGTITKIFSEEDVIAFAKASGDKNPLHLDEKYAARTRFGTRIVHGMLVSGLISAVLGTKIPGPGTVYLNQDINFKRPVFIGDEISAVVEVIKIRNGKHIYTLSTTCVNQNNEEVITGQAVVMFEEPK
jgi:3-hydroxybutyryl-CoA dehydratase